MNKSDNLEKEKKVIPVLSDKETISNYQPKDLKQYFHSDLGHFICTWLFCSLDDNKLSYKYNPKAVIEARCLDTDLNSKLCKAKLVSQK